MKVEVRDLDDISIIHVSFIRIVEYKQISPLIIIDSVMGPLLVGDRLAHQEIKYWCSWISVYSQQIEKKLKPDWEIGRD